MRKESGAFVGSSRSWGIDPVGMSEIVRFGAVGREAVPAVAPSLDFEAFFQVEKDQLYRALCLVTRNRYEAEDPDAGRPSSGCSSIGTGSRSWKTLTATCPIGPR